MEYTPEIKKVIDKMQPSHTAKEAMHMLIAPQGGERDPVSRKMKQGRVSNVEIGGCQEGPPRQTSAQHAAGRFTSGGLALRPNCSLAAPDKPNVFSDRG